MKTKEAIMANINKAVGRMVCMVCGETIVVRENQSGGLNCGCLLCDAIVRTKIGTMAHNKILKKIAPLKKDDENQAVESTKTAPAEAKGKNFLGI